VGIITFLGIRIPLRYLVIHYWYN